MVPGNLVIRADASSEMGIGHVMRCLALGREWKNGGGKVIFALATGTRELETRIRSQKAEVSRIDAVPGSAEDASRTIAVSVGCDAAWMVVDGYHFSADYLRILRTANSRLLMIADDEIPMCDCDMVVDPNLEPCRSYPEFGRRTELLRGPAYALLRREFLEYPQQRRAIHVTARRILITFGGGDFPNASLVALRALQEIVDSDLDVTVVVGPANPHRSVLQAAARESRHKVTLLHNVDNMANVMGEADLAITAAGGTCYELAFMQVPLLLITIADNQVEPAAAYASAKAAVSAGQVHSLNPRELSHLLADMILDHELRARLVGTARAIVDGKGAERIVRRMHALSGGCAGMIEPN